MMLLADGAERVTIHHWFLQFFLYVDFQQLGFLYIFVLNSFLAFFRFFHCCPSLKTSSMTLDASPPIEEKRRHLTVVSNDSASLTQPPAGKAVNISHPSFA